MTDNFYYLLNFWVPLVLTLVVLSISLSEFGFRFSIDLLLAA